ncbi:hypothetical protein [Leekyejoonella antrihumi]|uniref:Uncharacterized protein n=1 Tax=Leekyejoonella antrihumi TaxID=1660198 RepID=A0A563DVL1_9MICO|nr:hypothetical protein [Leekyejoonella antrihumi]TWP33982.1 hypothetical protein FGL98_19335 [Leekyejoonella antrihumi]
MPTLAQLGPSIEAAGESAFGPVLLIGGLAYATLIAPDTDPPSLARRVRVEAVVAGRAVACELLQVSGGGTNDTAVLTLTWKDPAGGAEGFTCTF